SYSEPICSSSVHHVYPIKVQHRGRRTKQGMFVSRMTSLRKDKIMIKRELLKASNQVKLTFIQPVNGSQTRISVVGDFNHWNPKANPLIKRSNNTASAS